MVRLWRQQGQRDNARDLLTPVYGWFTEGFDTADLQEAKALLNELGAERKLFGASETRSILPTPSDTLPLRVTG